MHTPAHLAFSLFVWRKQPGWGAASAIAAGAFLPDAPMFAFYGYQKLIRGVSEQEIWSRLYFDPSWQLFFDIFNSIPLMILLIAVSYWFNFRWGILLGASALFHLGCDLPLHNDDAHRHFLPLTHWRFASPVSYWDPKHYGSIFMVIELVSALAACVFVTWKGNETPMRLLAAATLLLYAVGICFALLVWLPLLGDH